MARYLVVLDMDLLAVDEQLDLESISYLRARRGERKPEVTVLLLSDRRQGRPPALEPLPSTSSSVTKFPVSPRPDHEPGRRPRDDKQPVQAAHVVGGELLHLAVFAAGRVPPAPSGQDPFGR